MWRARILSACNPIARAANDRTATGAWIEGYDDVGGNLLWNPATGRGNAENEKNRDQKGRLADRSGCIFSIAPVFALARLCYLDYRSQVIVMQ